MEDGRTGSVLGPTGDREREGARPSRTERGSQGRGFAQDCPDFALEVPDPEKTQSQANWDSWSPYLGLALKAPPCLSRDLKYLRRPQKYFHSF